MTAFEAREDIGGIWLPGPPDTNPPITPLYDSLTTNIPHPIVAFHEFPFPPETHLFPHATVVQDYLRSYAKHFGLGKHIRFRSRVSDLAWDSGRQKWTITLVDGFTASFDHVVIANGHYHRPNISTYPGLDEWKLAGTREVIHSMWYREPSLFRARRVLVVGGGPSGRDITIDASGVAKAVFQSVSKPELATPQPPIVTKPPISRFHADGRVSFADGSEEAIDEVVLATGYEYSYPFLRSIREAMPPPVPPLPSDLYNSKYHVFPLARNIFPLQSEFPPSSLALIGLLKKVAPFPMVEVEAKVVAKVFADPSSLDVEAEGNTLLERYDRLGGAAKDPVALGREWFTMRDEVEEFQTRMTLMEFAEVKGWEVQEWMLKATRDRFILRALWQEVERRGEADDWVRNVGKHGTQDWADLMEKLLESDRSARL